MLPLCARVYQGVPKMTQIVFVRT